MLRKTIKRPDGESGQALVLFALAITAMMGMLALAIDLGVVFGQRRFDQNAADAAALKVGHMLAGSVAPRSDPSSPSAPIDVYFSWPESEVYAEARRYAGLRSNDTSSAVSTSMNQNAGLTSRSRLDMTLEYWNTESYPDRWCFSPSGPAPVRTSSVPACIRFQSTLVPVPAANNRPFKVRATVSSTTTGFFVRAAGIGDVTPPAPANDAAPACSLPRVKPTGGSWAPLSGVAGNTTCAQAVLAIRGSSSPQYEGPGQVIPISTGYCQLTPEDGEQFIVLWGGAGQTEDCEYHLSSYANIVDLTDDSKWCDGSGPDYGFTNLMPSRALGSNCPTSLPDDWNRGAFVGDSVHPGNNQRDDMIWWLARGFNGTITTGMRLPTYCGVDNCSTTGNNVAAAFYCTSGNAHETSCDSSSQNSTGSYFFAKNQPGFHNVCPDRYGEQYGLGCRDVGVPVWDVPEKATGGGGGTGWTSSGSFAPDRVHIWKVLNFRIYCSHVNDDDPSTLCTQQPSIVGSGNSRVYGRFLGPVIVGGCTDCSGGPSINGNEAKLEG